MIFELEPSRSTSSAVIARHMIGRVPPQAAGLCGLQVLVAVCAGGLQAPAVPGAARGSGQEADPGREGRRKGRSRGSRGAGGLEAAAHSLLMSRSCDHSDGSVPESPDACKSLKVK